MRYFSSILATPIFEARLASTHFTVALVVELEAAVTLLLDECVEFVVNDDDDALRVVNDPCSFL